MASKGFQSALAGPLAKTGGSAIKTPLAKIAADRCCEGLPRSDIRRLRINRWIIDK
jgi:hypothetical protein